MGDQSDGGDASDRLEVLAGPDRVVELVEEEGKAEAQGEPYPEAEQDVASGGGLDGGARRSCLPDDLRAAGRELGSEPELSRGRLQGCQLAVERGALPGDPAALDSDLALQLGALALALVIEGHLSQGLLERTERTDQELALGSELVDAALQDGAIVDELLHGGLTAELDVGPRVDVGDLGGRRRAAMAPGEHQHVGLRGGADRHGALVARGCAHGLAHRVALRELRLVAEDASGIDLAGLGLLGGGGGGWLGLDQHRRRGLVQGRLREGRRQRSSHDDGQREKDRALPAADNR